MSQLQGWKLAAKAAVLGDLQLNWKLDWQGQKAANRGQRVALHRLKGGPESLCGEVFFEFPGTQYCSVPSKEMDTTRIASFAKELSMKYTTAVILVLVAALALIVEAEQSATVEAKVEITGHGELRIAGPYSHKNLAIYILHSDKQVDSETEYITMEEGIKAGLVKVTEAKRAQVEQLRVAQEALYKP